MLTYRIFKVWRRDLIVWQKYLLASLVANFGEPLLYLFAMGYGLGRFVTSFPLASRRATSGLPSTTSTDVGRYASPLPQGCFLLSKRDDRGVSVREPSG